jgi:hypothetical protein
MYPAATIAAPKDAIARPSATASAIRGKMKQPPTEAALIRLAIKLGYHALALPKLDILAVDELLCGFNGRVVVRAIKLDRADKMAIVADDVNPIIGQLRHPLPQEVAPTMRPQESNGVCSVSDSKPKQSPQS